MKRYDLTGYEYAGSRGDHLAPDPAGEWVRYEDAEAALVALRIEYDEYRTISAKEHELAEAALAEEKRRAEKAITLARSAPEFTRLVTTEAGDGIGWDPTYFQKIEALSTAPDRKEVTP